MTDDAIGYEEALGRLPVHSLLRLRAARAAAEVICGSPDIEQAESLSDA